MTNIAENNLENHTTNVAQNNVENRSPTLLKISLKTV
jgi:hypothetical protein